MPKNSIAASGYSNPEVTLYRSVGLREGDLVSPRRNAHGPPEAASKMSLIRKPRCSGNVAKGVAEPDQAGGEADTSLSQIAVRRHADCALERAKQSKGRQP